MARYIDAEAFLKKIERFSLSNGTTLGKHSGVADEIIDILIAEPTADVVPKSEVERLRGELARANRILREIKHAHRWGNDKKVARIIEEEW